MYVNGWEFPGTIQIGAHFHLEFSHAPLQKFPLVSELATHNWPAFSFLIEPYLEVFFMEYCSVPDDTFLGKRWANSTGHMWSLKRPTSLFARLTILAPVFWPNSNIGNCMLSNDILASFIRSNIHCEKWLAPKGYELNSLHSQLG